MNLSHCSRLSIVLGGISKRCIVEGLDTPSASSPTREYMMLKVSLSIIDYRR